MPTTDGFGAAAGVGSAVGPGVAAATGLAAGLTAGLAAGLTAGVATGLATASGLGTGTATRVGPVLVAGLAATGVGNLVEGARGVGAGVIVGSGGAVAHALMASVRLEIRAAAR